MKRISISMVSEADLEKWHCVRVPAGDMWDDAINWRTTIKWCRSCKSNGQFVGPIYTDVMHTDVSQYDWYFKDEEDALLFSLKWGSKSVSMI